MGHQRLKRSDPRFWGEWAQLDSSRAVAHGADMPFLRSDYNIKELALYDLPAMVDHVRRDTGYDKVRTPLVPSRTQHGQLTPASWNRLPSLDIRKATPPCSALSASSFTPHSATLPVRLR